MGKKKIIISPNIIEEFSQANDLTDISLKFVLSDDYHKVNIDLTKLLNNSLERRKEVHKFKEFLIKSPKSIATKKGYYKVFKQMVLTLKEDFSGDIHTRLKNYYTILVNKVQTNAITKDAYSSYRSCLRIIFDECYSINYQNFVKFFPESSQRINKIDNAQILDNQGKEKAFSKMQFREIGKIFFRLHEFFDSLIINRPVNQYTVNFKYQELYNIDVDLHWRGNHYLQNRNTFCLMVVFISLTGLNLTPLIKMKRSDIVIDKEREIISFNAICNRKGKIQSHNYPIKTNQLKFFEKILNNSLQVSPNVDILFPFVFQNLTIAHFDHHISKCYDFFNKGFCGDFKGFNITARKLRHSFGSQFEEIDLRSIALFNSINTAARNYSTGNIEENNLQLQNAMNIYTIALSSSENIQKVKESIDKIHVIEIKDINSLKKENSQITSSGIFCINSQESKEAETFKKRLNQLKLNNIDNVSCANILACFNCKNSIIVNDFENVYLLKSFYNYLNSIVYDSDTSSLFSDQNAVKNALLSISIILDNKLDKQLIKKVEKHIVKNGNHPLWDINGEFV